MNIKRGLLRLWAFASAVWALCFLGLAAPTWYAVAYLAAADWYRTSGYVVKEIAGCPGDPTPPPGSTFDDPVRCFTITHHGITYKIKVKGKYWTTSGIRDGSAYNPDLFLSFNAAGNLEDWSTAVDLTTGKFVTIGRAAVMSDDLETAKNLTLLAVLVPLAAFVLGCGLWWVAIGFSRKDADGGRP